MADPNLDTMSSYIVHYILFETRVLSVQDVGRVKQVCRRLRGQLTGDEYVDALHRSLRGSLENPPTCVR